MGNVCKTFVRYSSQLLIIRLLLYTEDTRLYQTDEMYRESITETSDIQSLPCLGTVFYRYVWFNLQRIGMIPSLKRWNFTQRRNSLSLHTVSKSPSSINFFFFCSTSYLLLCHLWNSFNSRFYTYFQLYSLLNFLYSNHYVKLWRTDTNHTLMFFLLLSPSLILTQNKTTTEKFYNLRFQLSF